MQGFRLTEDEERIRSGLFPHQTPREFAQMVQQKRLVFEALPEEEKDSIHATAMRLQQLARRSPA